MYTDAGLKKRRVRESSWAEACNAAINSAPSPGYAVIVAADVRKWFALPVDPAAWGSTCGVEIALEQVVGRVIAAMRTTFHLQSCTCPNPKCPNGRARHPGFQALLAGCAHILYVRT